jgi:hypothetical protein
MPDQDAWDAWHPEELARRLAGIDRPWCVVGGWALDLWHGRVTREHHDLEFTVLREDFGCFRQYLLRDIHEANGLPPILPLGRRWPEGSDEVPSTVRTPLRAPHRLASARHFSPRGEEGERRVRLPSLAFYTVSSGVFEVLPDDVEPHPSISQIWCLDIAACYWRVDIMIEPGTAETWTCKRDHTIARPRSEVVRHSPDGIPYLGPAAILLLKAKHQRPKDEADFDMALPTLDAAERAWLRAGLARLHPGHVWIERL